MSCVFGEQIYFTMIQNVWQIINSYYEQNRTNYGFLWKANGYKGIRLNGIDRSSHTAVYFADSLCNRSNSALLIPTDWSFFLIRFLSTISNARFRSSDFQSTSLLSFICWYQSCKTKLIADSHEWPLRYLDCCGTRISLSSIYFTSYFFTMVSSIFPTVGNIFIGIYSSAFFGFVVLPTGTIVDFFSRTEAKAQLQTFIYYICEVYTKDGPHFIRA